MPGGLDKVTSSGSFQPQHLCDSEQAELTVQIATEHWVVLRFKHEAGCVGWNVTATDHQLPVLSLIGYKHFNVDRTNCATSV